MNRRNVVLFAFVCACLCVASFAFTFDLGIGIKAGVVSPWYEGFDYDLFLDSFALYRQPDFGLSAGGFLTLGLAKFICIQPEAFFSMLGGRGGDEWLFLKDQATVIDLHLLLKLRFIGKRIVFYPFGGPSLFFEVGEKKFRVADKYSNTTVLTGTWVEEYIRVPVFGVTGGVGLEVPRPWVTWSVDLRYNHSLQSRFTEGSVLTDWYQKSIQLMMGLTWVVVGSGPGISRSR